MVTLVEQQNEFLKRWKVTPISIHIDEEIELFMDRIFNLFKNYGNYTLHGYEYNLDLNHKLFDIYYPSSPYGDVNKKIYWLLNKDGGVLNFLFKLKFLINHACRFYYVHDYGNTLSKQFLDAYHVDLIENLIKCFELSNVNIKMLLNPLIDPDDGETYAYNVDFYPKGDEVLDNALIDELIPWLSENSKKLFQEALKSYLERDYENSANSLRKSLESWLKFSLGVDKTMNNIFSNLGDEVKRVIRAKYTERYGKDQEKVNAQLTFIGDFIGDTFPSLEKIFKKYEIPHNNGGLKHAKIEVVNLLDSELEFMIYQTGAIMRFIDKVLNIDEF